MIAHHKEMKVLLVLSIQQMVNGHGLLSLLQDKTLASSDEEMVGIICERLCTLVESNPKTAMSETTTADTRRILLDVLCAYGYRNDRILGSVSKVLSILFPRN